MRLKLIPGPGGVWAWSLRDLSDEQLVAVQIDGLTTAGVAQNGHLAEAAGRATFNLIKERTRTLEGNARTVDLD